MDDVFNSAADPAGYWTTTNLGEALPGVQSPLSWTVWRPAIEIGTRAGFGAIGALERRRVVDPADPHERMVAVFHGRAAARVEFLGEMGDRLPGTSGAAIAEQFLGALPPDFRSEPTLKRLPAIAVLMPLAIATAPRRVRAVHAESTRRWTDGVARIPSLPLASTLALFADAAASFRAAFSAHAVVNFANVQPAYDAINRLATAAGRPELAGKLLAGQGSHPELMVVRDCWELSRGTLSQEEFIARHGYHGPQEGELESFSWREDSAPVEELRRHFAARPDTESPAALRRRLASETAVAKRELLRALPGTKRAAARVAFAAADRFMGLRGVGKAAFLQSFDLCRAAARHAGTLLAADGALRDPADVFYLTADELISATTGATFADIVSRRRDQRERERTVTIPGAWRGRPPVHAPDAAVTQGPPRIKGTGASPGVVEGPVRVITDPDFAQVEPGEILVATVTDPSWAPIMFISSGLVVDIGGLLSHPAVVARELGIPCVMGTLDGTKRLRTGDICRVDGHAGTVEVIRRADRRDDTGGRSGS